jgi:hypothetical protein
MSRSQGREIAPNVTVEKGVVQVQLTRGVRHRMRTISECDALMAEAVNCGQKRPVWFDAMLDARLWMSGRDLVQGWWSR